MSLPAPGVKGYLYKRPIIPAWPDRLVKISNLSHPLPEPKRGEEAPGLPNPDNVQGDVYLTLPKRFERFLFFAIKDITRFRTALFSYVPLITSSAEVTDRIHQISENKKKEDLDFGFSNIAFYRTGLNRLGVEDKLGDPQFDGSASTTKPQGVILVTAKKEVTCEALLSTILAIFSESTTPLETPAGHHREGGREFFGWRDGISQPALDGLTVPTPGQLVVKPGVIILGYPGDPAYDEKKERPAFTKDGSFLVYTKLQQDVWLFNHYVEKNWHSVPAKPAEGYCLTDKQRKSLFCARLFGRFASGVPLALSPYIDDHAFLSDDLINNFTFKERSARAGCPLFAHVLKTNPRSIDSKAVPEDIVKESMIVRAGIPYGPEFSKEELEARPLDQSHVIVDFSVSYQASIANGFLRQLNVWSRGDGFPPSFAPVGQDPIIGNPQQVWDGLQASTDTSSFVQPEYIRQLDGGLYFTPSIKTVGEWATAN